jgi:hypothetical protein
MIQPETIALHLAHRPELDPGFVPAPLWNRAYRKLVARDKASRPLMLALVRENNSVSIHQDWVLSKEHPASALTLVYLSTVSKITPENFDLARVCRLMRAIIEGLFPGVLSILKTRRRHEKNAQTRIKRLTGWEPQKIRPSWASPLSFRMTSPPRRFY